MGCFLACFGSSKNRRRRRPSHRVLPKDQRDACCNHHLQPTTLSPNQESVEQPSTSIEQTSVRDDGLDEQLSFNTRRKVTFDLNVKTYEEVSSQQQEISKDQEKEEKRGKSGDDDSITPTMGSYQSNHRYQNCSNSDDEYELESEDEDDLDDFNGDDDDEIEYDVDNAGVVVAEGESSESFFSLPAEKRDSTTPLAENEVNSPVPRSGVPPAGELKTTRSNQNTRDRSQYVHSVLNPVENLSQWKVVKAKSTPGQKHQKENLNFEPEPQIPFSSEPTFKSSIFSFNKDNDRNEPQREEIAVDTSLSNWLGSSNTTLSKTTSNASIGNQPAEGSKSPRPFSPTSLEDRPILGALTVEEIRQFSASSSPRKSPSRSPDDMPILGTVGRYWSHTGQAKDSSSGSSYKGIPNSTSKYREDNKVNWHSTPFETRLERALKEGAAESS